MLHIERVSEWASESETIVVRVSFFIQEKYHTKIHNNISQQRVLLNQKENTTEHPKN